MYTFLLAIIYLVFISLGLPDSLLGAAWPAMRLAFEMPTAAAGIVSMTISAGTICSSLLSERLTKRTSTQLVTTLSVALTAAALLGFSFSDSFFMLLLWAIPYGLGAGAIDSAINNYVALHYAARHMSWLHCFWGVGTIISPYIMSIAIMRSTWSAGYRAVAAIQLAIVVILLLTLRAWRVNGSPAEQGEGDTDILGLRGALRIKGAPSLFIGFFAYCAAEGTAMLWASSYLTDVKRLDEPVAAAFAALFFIGITVGRFISGFVSEKLGDRKMVRLGSAVALAAALLILLSGKSTLPALIGLCLFGMGCAPVYPSVIHATPVNFGAKNSQAIIGIQMASAYVGSTFMPPLFGLISAHTGLSILPVYLMFFIILMLIMVENTFNRSAAILCKL